MRISKRGNKINSAVKRISDNKGVTLSILVVTIIILIILAGITLSAVIGNNGLVKTSEIIEERQIISELTQDLKLKASQARTNRISTDETSLKDIFLNNLKEQGIIEDKDVNPEKDTYITVDDKYVYLVEEKNDDLYIDYRGKVGALFPKIIDISLTNTTNSIATTVTAIDADKFNFYIKDSEDGEYRLLDENNEEGKYTYGGLRQDKIYYLKFVAINENGEDILEVTRITGVLPTGTITIGDFDWSHETERATFIITTKAQGFILQYTTTPSDIDSWKDITSGTRTEGIEVGKTVYARLWDRVNEADEEYASATVQPQEGSVVLEATSGMTTYPDTLTINILENLSRGRLRVESSNENIATGVAIVSGNKRTGTLIIKPGTTAGTTTLRVISEETKSYKEAEAIFEITVEKGTLNVTSTGYTGIYDGEAHAIDVRCAQEGAIITYSQTENGTYSEEKPTYTNAGTYTTYYKVDLAGYYTYEGHEAVTIGKQKVLSPTNLQVTTEGKVYWDESSNATGYEISIDNSNWQTATSGIDYLNKITEQKGTRIVYVRAINSDSSNYVISDNAVKDVTVLTLSITKNSEVRGTVDCASYNVISGVTYETNNNVLTVKAGNTTLKEVTATANEGYSFNKWSIASGTITKDTTVTAEFDIDTYTIEYTLNEGQVIGQNPTSYTVETNEITLINPTRNGYTFIGWSGTELTGNENKSVKIAKGSVGDRAYEAHWVEKTYTLSINPNGGKIDDSTTTVTRNLKYSDVSYINNPTREGHTFEGWNELSNAQYSNGLSSITVYNNARNGVVTITTQAKSADNPITGMTNEVKIVNSGAAQTTPGLGGFLHGKTVSANKKYVHVIVAKLPSGYYFHNAYNQLGAGATTQWLTSNEGTGKWQTYIYQVNSGSSGTFSNFGFVYVSKDKDNTWSVRSPETGAYTAYIAYSNIYDITNDDTGIGQIDGTGVLTANWTANTYTVVYNGNGNTGGSTASSMHTYDVSKNLTANGFTKAYTITYNYNGATGGNSNETSTSTYTFAGWATSASGNKVYDDQASVKNLATSGTFDLYAKWSGGAITLPTPTKTGYTFGGWFTNSGLTASAGAAGASYTATENITLYAKWTVNSYSLVKLSGNNLITNGTFDAYTIADAPSKTANGVTHTWDKELNGIPGNTDKAYDVTGWGIGHNMGVAVPEIGYHAHMKIVNNNNVLDYKTNEAYNGKTQADVPGGSVTNGTVTTGRWLGFYQGIIASKLTAGKTYAITMDIYRVSGTTYINTGLYHKTNSNQNNGFQSGTKNLIPTTTGKWETFTYVFTLSPDYLNTSNPSLFIYGNYGGSGELYVDNVRLEEVTPINKNYDVAYTSSEVAELTKTGYTFDGWYNNSSFTTRLSTTDKFTTSTATFEDVQTAGTTATIFAKWTADTYTITLSNESATTAGTTAIYETYGSEYSLTSGGNAMTTSANPITVPTRTGYTFDGYYTQANGGTKYIDSTGKLTSSASNTQFSSNGTLYAHWTKTVNSLTNSISPTSYIYDGNAKTPTETVKDGNTSLTKNTDYTIVFTNNTNVGEATATITGKNAYNSTTKAYYTGETTIIYYINNAKITFNVAENSGTISGTNTLYTKKGVTEVYTDIRNTTQGVIPTATKAGYTFNGWYTAASGGTKVINADKSVVASVTNWTDANKKWQITEDKILYAQFTYTATPTITRDDFNTFSYTADGATAYYVSTSSTKPNPGTAQSTFALNKWTTAVTTGNNITLADGQTYYVWAENTASTTGTVGNSANIIVRKVTRSQGTGSTLTTRIDGTSASTGTENTTTPYYVLNGTPVWSIATANTGYNTPVLKEGNTSRTATGYKIVVNSNITISSSATANNYTVEYYNGSTKLGSSNHVYGTSKNLTTIATLGGSDSTYTKFEGWATANNSVTIAHTDGKSVSNLTSTNSGTVKLYAVWSRTVNFYSGNSTTAVTKTQYKNTSTYSVEAPAPTAITGWTALGWRVNTTAADKSYGAGTASTITSNAGPNFYAVYSREANFYSGKNKATTKKATQYHNNGSNGTGTYSVSIPADNITSINTGGGWNIQGWRADTSASSKSYNTTGNITANAGPTFYAIYTRSLTMAYNANGGTGTTASHTSTQYYTSYNAVSSVTFKTAANGFSKDAYEFSKWANDSASGTQVVAGGNAAAFTPGVDSTATTKTMYAIWTPINYTITYELDSGSITGQKTSYNIETATFTIPNPKKIGFRFMGWTGSNNLSSGLESYTTSNPYICSSRDHALGNEFTVTPGTTYRIFVTARRTSGDLWMKGGIWYTQQSSGNSYDGYDGYFTHLKQINNIWDIYYKDVTVPAGKTKGKIYIMLEQNISGGSTSWIVADMYAINPSATVTVPQGSKGDKTYKANWEETFTSKEFSYTGNVQTFTVPETGTYKLEVWGAQGGSTYGGKGGYSYGNISLSAGSTLYVVVGGQGEYKDSTKATANGGYNGGGPGHCYGDEGDGGSGGGGATHIGTFNSTLAEHGNTTGLYIVAGGGGGFARWSNGQISNGGTGGGTSGGSSTIIGGGTTVEGGTQTTGNAFGQGGNGTGDNCGGGGGGLYGGKAKNLNGIGGAGGSGYIGGVTNGSTQNGIQEGNGKAKITIIE